MRNLKTAPVISVSRHRIQTDGRGVTSLVCFHGCPLRCKWCINPFSFDEKTRYTCLTPEELYEQTKIDELYFLASGGGVTFGGGEPLLYADFIKEFRAVCGEDWHLCIETSLAVPFENVKTVAECVDFFYIDCKDTNPDIYRRYTGKENSLMLENLKKLLEIFPPEKIMVRLPIIPEFNSEEDRQKSHDQLKKMGVKQFNMLKYIVKN